MENLQLTVEGMFSLRGKTALVAGASRGIGLSIAEAIAAAGAHTVLASRSVEKLETEAARLRGQGYSAAALALDVTSSDSIRQAVDALPSIDILVNVAGANIRKRFEEFTKEEYQYLLKTNLDGLFELTQLVGKKMIAAGKGGRIVMIGSLMSILGLPYLGVYAVTKGALGQLAKVLAAEWGRYGIQVNCIAPGFVITDLNRAMWQDPKMHDWLKGVQANPEPGTPGDVAPLAVFLCGAGARYITGQIIAVDGGYSTTRVWPFEV